MAKKNAATTNKNSKNNDKDKGQASTNTKKGQDNAKDKAKAKGGNVNQTTGKPQEFRCAKKGCKQLLVCPKADDIRGRIVQVTCSHCRTPNFLQYHCWACATPLDGIDYKRAGQGPQGQCPECGAYNPAKIPREKDSCDDTSNRCIDRIMFAFTAFVQPYCVYSQTMWIYPFVLASKGASGSILEKILYGITFFVSAGTLFNYWSGVFTPIKLHPLPKRSEIRLKSNPGTNQLQSMNKYHFCAYCKAPRAPRDHHCNICRTCVPIMDHHCPFYGGSCVGRHNHRNFILFLLFMMMTTVWLTFTTVVFFQHLPSFPRFVFKREFSKQILKHCKGASPFCPLSYIWSFEEVSMFGVVVIQLLLTILTFILVSVLFQQQVTDLMESRTRLEGIIAASKRKKREAALAAGENFEGDNNGAEKKDDETEDEDHFDAEANKWGELRDVCGPGRGLFSWIFTPYIGTLPSKFPNRKKHQ